MRFYLRVLLILSFVLPFTATTCEEEPSNTCDALLEEMSMLKNEIDVLINAATCSEITECKSIAFGSKPCGGPWSYLVYSTTINTDQLELLVSQYNELESQYNMNCDAVSDCMFVGPPNELACENGKCVIVN